MKKDWIENNCLKFLNYFDKTYMQELYGWGNWYRKPGIPCTNNAVEGFNNYMKILNNRELKELGNFFNSCFNSIKELSQQRQKYSFYRKIDPNIWELVDAASKVLMKIYIKEGESYYISDKYCFLSFLDKKRKIAKTIKIFDEIIQLQTANLKTLVEKKLFKKPSSQTLKWFIKFSQNLKTIQDCFELSSVRKLSISPPSPEQESYFRVSCTCRDFFDLRYCVHSLSLGVGLKLFPIPNNLLLLGNYFFKS